MASPAEKARRKQLRDAYKNAEREVCTSLMPIDRDRLTALVDFVDGHVAAEGCDHTRRFSERWAREQGIDWEFLRRGLDEFGGFCDCEVVMNCDSHAVFGC
ncbi:DUF2695 domain-containing protein [Micromonospora sp. NBC_01638]|uniref:DUF2695 domain-containing protein n=1 Tax=Micromonospora sp. NBC_01638 TaxID=2975982 RepID=UPI00386DC79A|nr:DUF2695 domain-containing protein [Micromonospora sp. NBC_01638]